MTVASIPLSTPDPVDLLAPTATADPANGATTPPTSSASPVDFASVLDTVGAQLAPVTAPAPSALPDAALLSSPDDPDKDQRTDPGQVESLPLAVVVPVQGPGASPLPPTVKGSPARDGSDPAPVVGAGTASAALAGAALAGPVPAAPAAAVVPAAAASTAASGTAERLPAAASTAASAAVPLTPAATQTRASLAPAPVSKERSEGEAADPSGPRPLHRADAAAGSAAQVAAPPTPSASLTPSVVVPVASGASGTAAQASPTQAAVTISPTSSAALQHAVRVVSTAATPAVSQVVLRLDPPGIGTISVRMVNHGGEVTVAIRADTTEAASAVASTRDQVGQALATQGLSLGDVRVSSSASNGAGADQSAGSWTSANSNSGSGTGGFSGGQSNRDLPAPVPAASYSPVARRTHQPAATRQREGTWL